MKLSEIKLPTKEIQVPGGKISVRGLSFADVTKVMAHHGDAVVAAFAGHLKDAAVGMDPKDVGVIAKTLMSAAPEAVALIIALANGEDSKEAVAAAKSLGVTEQVEILEAVAVLTFKTEHDVKKLIETITRGITGVSTTVSGLR